MIIAITILLLETLYCYIIFKEFDIIGKNKKMILFISILAIIVVSGLIFNTSIFRYLFLPISYWILIKILNTKNKIYNFAIILTILFFKFIIEYIVMLLLYNRINVVFINFIFEFISIIFALTISTKIKSIQNSISKLWNNSKAFYFRYTFLTLINVFILFLIYNLIKLKEVLQYVVENVMGKF